MINTIWVVNHSGHNIEPALRDFRPKGVEYLTEGNQNIGELDRLKYNMYQRLYEGKFNYETDAILICGNTVLNIIVTAVLCSEFKVPHLRLLIWDGRRRFYYLKDLDMGGLHRVTPDQIAQFHG